MNITRSLFLTVLVCLAGSTAQAAVSPLRDQTTAMAKNEQFGAETVLEDTIIWPGAQIASRSDLRNCVVRANQKAEGILRDIDI